MIGGLPNAMVAKVLNLQPFGPTGVVNGNQLSSVGQGLKKLFKPQPEYPRIFTLGDDGAGTGRQKRGSNTGVLPTVGGCPCSFLDLELLLAFFGGSGYAGVGDDEKWIHINSFSEQLYDGISWTFAQIDQRFGKGNENGNYPTNGAWYKRKRACLRFVCRCVNGGSVKQTTYGGPTTYDKDLWNECLQPFFGNESSSGNYFYIVSFYGWKKITTQYAPDPSGALNWYSDDSFFDIGKFTITKT